MSLNMKNEYLYVETMRMAKNMLSAVADSAAGSSPTSISGGVVKINANVNATFFVK